MRNPTVLRNVFTLAGLETGSTVFSQEVQHPVLKVIFDLRGEGGG